MFEIWAGVERPGGFESPSSVVFVCKGLKTKKLPLLGAFSTKMAEEEGFEPS